MEEMLILVSPRDRPTGTAPKMQVHRQGLRHRAFSIFIFDPHGRLLLQRRAAGKYHSAGLWTNTCCGHPRPGERTPAAARRRLQEEMGLTCDLLEVTAMLYREQVTDQLIEHEYDHLLIGLSTADPQANPEEAQDWQWLTLEALTQQLLMSPERFTVWLRRIFETFGSDTVGRWAETARQHLGDAEPAPASAWHVPPLHCPAPFRIDDALADTVDDLLLPWVARIGIFDGQLDKIRASGFGRFATLCHTDTDDPDRLLLSAQCIAALFAVDDHYCDDERTGSQPRRVGPRLSVALAALEPVHLTAPFHADLVRALERDPVLVALQAYMKRVEAFATPSQVARVRHEVIAMFVTMTAEAAWRTEGIAPALWEYLAQRQTNSFLPCMSLIDVIGGYELPANVYSHPAVRRVTTLAASATIIANDLFSAPKESLAAIGDFNLPGLMIRALNGSPQDAMARSAAIHDQVMRQYEDAERTLLADADPLLARYLKGVKSWVAGSLEWHRHSGRYRV
ncbi:isopentenyl-diphosphate Delta-isomerase [Pseudomonas ekonensis]|uniref:isopentenyl-diphosphate Delta-isomerase n=1 Tax=Pseudomonas ekonensis TaxID=2842353 RepID=UPI0021F2C6D2|nr:isopentenyl-diphosphate Delta-isomerase [Pseudomonas ekonensis]